MNDHDISFENLPNAVAFLINEVGDLKLLLTKEHTTVTIPSKNTDRY